MFKKIINKKILKLAYDLSNYGIKKKSKYTSNLKNKKCGDKIKVELQIKNKKIINMCYETESCILCQASASLLSKSVKNTPIKDLDKILKSRSYENLMSKKYLPRRDCIMLPYNALKKAL